jgi:site-specific recombinase XerD
MSGAQSEQQLSIFGDGEAKGERSVALEHAIEGEVVEEGDGSLLPGPRDIYEAFALFLQVDVAHGDASEDTLKAYHREIKFWVEWCQRHRIEPEKATRRHVEAYREDLKSRGMGVSTRSHKLSIVRRFYESGVKYGLLDVNPAQRVRGGKDLTPPEEKMHAFTGEALVSLLGRVPQNTLSGMRDRAIVALMAIHGLRRVEVHRLNHSDFVFDGETSYLNVTGQANKMRRVYLRPDTAQAIASYAKEKGEVGLPTEGALFLAHGNRARGERLSRRGINLVVDLYLSETSLKRAGVSCQALRHTFGTLAVEGGAQLSALREAMGHSNIETTGMYARAVERKRQNPSNFIDVEV